MRFEPLVRHCQLGGGSALLPRDIDAPDPFQQAHVTASHSTNARVRSVTRPGNPGVGLPK